MNRSYIYLSLRMFPIIRVMVVAILAINLVSWVTHMWSAWITIGILLGFLGVMVLHLGRIRVIDDGVKTRIEFSDLYRKISLPVPIQVKPRWTYSFNEGLDSTDTQESVTLSSRANDLHVYLLFSGPNNEVVTLHEFIGIDSRFPNESEYAERIPASGTKIEVQRTDKILEFLQTHLDAEELSVEKVT